MKFFRTLLIISASAATLAANADVSELPTTIVGGTPYHYYEVKAKETVYSLCHKLGVSHEYLLKCNPTVADGLKTGQTLYFPSLERTSSSKEWKVEPGETIYGIAKKNGVTSEALITANPQITDGLKSGQILIIPTASPKTNGDATVKAYIVQPKETFYSIAQANNVTVAALEAANPGVSALREGQVLNIPVTQPASASLVENQPFSATVTSESVQPSQGSQRVEIAVMLPFMLEQPEVSKQALRVTEYYKGLLIAVDSMRNSGIPITVRAYDTKGSDAAVREILSRPALQHADVIIAPDDAGQLALISDYGLKHSILVFNPFVVRDGTYAANKAMMQASIPSAQMVKKAAGALAGRYARYVPVFLTRVGGAEDKADFVEQAKAELNARGVKWKEIKYDNKLRPGDLSSLEPSGTQYIFVPISGKQAEANRFMPGLIEWRDAKSDTDPGRVRVFGYPEWVTFRGETFQNMHELGAVVYSRFNANPTSWRGRVLDGKFKRFYGSAMEQETPRQGAMGFDGGMYLIKALSDNAPSSFVYDGVQNPFDFVKVPGGGWRNDALYLINYRPGGLIEETKL